jgi:hypothetical protein
MRPNIAVIADLNFITNANEGPDPNALTNPSSRANHCGGMNLG